MVLLLGVRFWRIRWSDQMFKSPCSTFAQRQRPPPSSFTLMQLCTARAVKLTRARRPTAPERRAGPAVSVSVCLSVCVCWSVSVCVSVCVGRRRGSPAARWRTVSWPSGAAGRRVCMLQTALIARWQPDTCEWAGRAPHVCTAQLCSVRIRVAPLPGAESRSETVAIGWQYRCGRPSGACSVIGLRWHSCERIRTRYCCRGRVGLVQARQKGFSTLATWPGGRPLICAHSNAALSRSL